MNLRLCAALPAFAVGMLMQGLAQTDGANSGLILPHVVHGNEPAYPKIAIAARVSGTVRLHVVTDGTHISKIETETGPAMLIKPTEETVQSWEFEKHEPATFDVTFVYILLEPNGCEGVKSGVRLDLPSRVEVSDGPVMCDIERFKRQQRYLREQHVYPVELHVTMDGETIANPSEVTISNGERTLKLPVRDGLFLVPEVLAGGPKLSLSAIVGSDAIAIPGIDPYSLKCIWNIGLANKQPDTDDPAMKGRHVQSACTISFDPLDGDGVGMVVDPCRTPAKR